MNECSRTSQLAWKQKILWMLMLLLCKRLQWIVGDPFSCFHSSPILVHTLLWQVSNPENDFILPFPLLPIHPNFPVISRFSSFIFFHRKMYFFLAYRFILLLIFGTFYSPYAKWEAAWEGWKMPGVVHSSTKRHWHLWPSQSGAAQANSKQDPSQGQLFLPRVSPAQH